MVRRTRQLCLADPDSAITLLVEPGEQLSETHWLGSGDDPEGPVRLPAALPWLQELIGDGLSHERGHEPDLASLDCCPACNRRRAEKDDSPRWLLWEALQKPVDHEPPQAVADEVHPRRSQLADESVQAGGNL